MIYSRAMRRTQQSISGFALARGLFRESGGKNIDALVDFAGGETDWLEFKAGLFARPKDLKEGERQEDALWHVARAVFGFLNSSGGLIVLGIDDKRKPADLRKSERGGALADEGMEAYLRKVVEPNLPPRKKKWETGRSGRLSWNGLNPALLKDAISVEPAKFRGKDVVLVFVEPLGRGQMEIVHEGDLQVLLVRQPGHIAKVDSIKDVQEMFAWTTRRRKIEKSEFADTLERFKKERAEQIRPKTADAPARADKRRSSAKRLSASRKPVLLRCPECGEYIPGAGKNGNQKCSQCGKTFSCRVYEDNFVSQPDDVSSGWAVAKWLFGSFGRRLPDDAVLRRKLKVKKGFMDPDGVVSDDFMAVLEGSRFSVERINVAKSDLTVSNSEMCETFSNGGRVAIVYATDILPGPETRGATRWIGLERTDRGIVRVMDPWYACGYLTLKEWKEAAMKDVSSIVSAFAVYEGV